MRKITTLMMLFAACCVGIGCSDDRRTAVDIKIQEPDIEKQVRATLQNYAKGLPLASEVMTFDSMVKEYEKVDRRKAEILKEGFEELKAVKGSPAAKAKEILRKLGMEDKVKDENFEKAQDKRRK